MAVERTTTTTTSSGAPTPAHETVRDREVIREHHTTGDRGIGTLIVGALLVLVVAFLGIYMVNALAGSDSEVIPDEMNIDITDSNGGGGAEAPADSGDAEAPADSGGAEAPADSGEADAPAQ